MDEATEKYSPKYEKTKIKNGGKRKMFLIRY